MIQKNSSYPKIAVKAERKVAHDSPDHILPWGTRHDSSRNSRFNKKLYYLYPKQKDVLRILDLGCSGGGFVRDCLNDGCVAVGLEGSDFSKRHHRAEWATIPDFLFTCDITRDFGVSFENDINTQLVQFDVITSWEVMEHIAEVDLPRVAANVKKHIQPSGLWIMSISPNEEVIDGVRLHQTVRPKEWWTERFARLGFKHLEEYVQYFNTQFVRGPKYGAPGSFHLIVSTEPSSAPPIPKQGWRSRLYDTWLGSPAQKLVRRWLVGEL